MIELENIVGIKPFHYLHGADLGAVVILDSEIIEKRIPK